MLKQSSRGGPVWSLGIKQSFQFSPDAAWGWYYFIDMGQWGETASYRNCPSCSWSMQTTFSFSAGCESCLWEWLDVGTKGRKRKEIRLVLQVIEIPDSDSFKRTNPPPGVPFTNQSVGVKHVCIYMYMNLVLLFANERSLLCGSSPTVWKYGGILRLWATKAKGEMFKSCFWP